MRIRVSSPGNDLSQGDLDDIERDLDKIARRFADRANEATTDVRIKKDDGSNEFRVVVELHYGKNHLVAKHEHSDMGQAVRAAREEILRQINDRKHGGHTSMAKGR